jgi:hypothetical protein
MKSRRIRLVLPAAALLSLVIASLAIASSQDHGKGQGWGKNRNEFKAFLTGHNEVPATHSKATGRLSLKINDDNTMSFTLSYSGLANPATMAHVHFGQPLTNGGVSFFLCGGGGKPTCEAGTTTPVSVTGTIAAADVQLIPTQLLPANDLAAIAEEIRAGFAYANVHTAISPGGEIRGQLHRKHGWGKGFGHDRHDD